ncbi:MAG: Mut7-C RNAse domain-containing protein [Dehalococcoidales bacterium]|jgi:uncharacterized protein with PIN domain
MGASINDLKFIVDENVGKLARWLRMMGFDSVFFTGEDDAQMVRQALAENRILLTRDTGIIKRRAVSSGRLKAILFTTEEPEEQMRQLMAQLDISQLAHPFTICMECNQPLAEVTPADVKDRVPPYVYKTQTRYVACPACRRVYWRGTHWAAMLHRLEKLSGMTEN